MPNLRRKNGQGSFAVYQAHRSAYSGRDQKKTSKKELKTTFFKSFFIFSVILVIFAGLFFIALPVISYLMVAARPLESIEVIEKYAEEDDFDTAILACKRRLLADPAEYVSILFLGNLYEENAQYEKAERIFLGLLRKDPSDLMAHLYLGKTYYRHNRIENAIEDLEFFRSGTAGSSEVRKGDKQEGAMMLADIYLQFTKEYAKAIGVLKELLKEYPNDWEARYSLGSVYTYAKQYASAYGEFNKIVQECPDKETVKYAENAIQYVRERRNPAKSSLLLI